MNPDNEYIAKLYESIYRIDPLNKAGDVDWDSFFHKAVELSLFSTLLEDFKLKEATNHSNGRTEVYDIKTAAGKKFLLTLEFYNKKKFEYFAFAGIQGSRYKNSPRSEEYFEKLKDSFKDDETICFVRFEDEQGKYNLTKEVGMSSFEVFSSLKSAILHSFDTNPAWSKQQIKGITFMVMKQEQNERLPLYKKLITKYFPDFSEIFLDEVSDKDYINLIATRK